ncbi:DoxX family protein [Jiulongibacter sediminis]|uniref:Membrane protein n=1 Tax=Jiulongibacter sediminis TaxID=1605367 RepID=A0A0P7BV11_9BACT|nr:DoxX family protein [Jiulongibacter sediminis]KPM48712.1 membrane protein [Jiulongibacter sediminis]TBX25248.1 membrane protein [Jiulongibacter sediminis]
MKPLIVLLSSFILLVAFFRLTRKEYEYAKSARIAMAFMLFFTAIAHFIFTDGMAMMIPHFLPFKKGLVYLTGFLEILGGAGLLVPRFKELVGRALVVFFILILPANTFAAVHHIDYQNGSDDGPGMAYLWFRVPLQLLFIAWVYYSTLSGKIKGK